MKNQKLIRITTVPQSLRGLLKGQLDYMNQYYEVVGISSGGEILQEVAVNEKIRVVPVEMTRTISPTKDLKSVWQLYKLFRKEKPLIVHTHTPKAGTVGMLAAYLAGVPHRLHTIAGLPLLVTKGKKRKLLDLVEKLTYKCATKVYPNSYGMYNIVLENRYTKKSKLKVIGKGSSNGINTNHFKPTLVTREQQEELKRELNIQQSDFIYLYVGRVVKDKGINELVEAFQNINRNHLNTKLLLVGSYEKHLDPLKPDTERAIKSNKNILAVGFKRDVRPYFTIANVLTFPSYREGFPNVVMQAGAMELPSIVSNINGCNEIITHGKNGLIIPSQNIEKLEEQMLEVYNNSEKLLEMSKNCREIIVKNYERQYIWEELKKEYDSLTK